MNDRVLVPPFAWFSTLILLVSKYGITEPPQPRRARMLLMSGSVGFGRESIVESPQRKSVGRPGFGGGKAVLSTASGRATAGSMTGPGATVAAAELLVLWVRARRGQTSHSDRTVQ